MLLTPLQLQKLVDEQLFSRVDATLAHHVFVARLRALLEDAAQRGRPYWVISLYRTYLEQDGIYAQGRTTPGPVVTKAKGGQSAHNFGIAADLCLDGFIDRKGLQPDWRPESYALLGELAPAHGLLWGGTFGDNPHVQLPGYVTAAELLPLRQLYEARGLPAVYDFLNKELSHG